MHTVRSICFLMTHLWWDLPERERKPIRILFVYVPLVLLLLFFNPLFAKVVYFVADDEIYYRILWLLPMTVVIAFSVVKVVEQLRGRKKLLFALAAALVVTVSGGYIYHNP